MTDLDELLADLPIAGPSLTGATCKRSHRHRFWARAYRTEGCWEWRGHRNGSFGYGRVTINGRRELAHRWAWLLVNGPIPEGLWVLHHCDNPQCVRPDHLYLGTATDNAHDRDIRNRGSRGAAHAAKMTVRRGSQNKRAKLTESQVAEIRRRYTGRYGQQQELAEEYGIHRMTLHRIVHRQRWTHVG